MHMPAGASTHAYNPKLIRAHSHSRAYAHACSLPHPYTHLFCLKVVACSRALKHTIKLLWAAWDGGTITVSCQLCHARCCDTVLPQEYNGGAVSLTYKFERSEAYLFSGTTLRIERSQFLRNTAVCRRRQFMIDGGSALLG